MALPSLMNIGASALRASQMALTTAGNNVSNVNTPGYSRQSLQTAPALSQFTGSGFVGNGVDVVTVQRSYNSFLGNAANTAQAQSSADTARSTQLSQLESLFPIGANGLGAKVDALFSAFSDMQNTPSDTTARSLVLSSANTLVTSVNGLSAQLDGIQSGVQSQMAVDVKQVNALTSQIAALNLQVALARGSGQQPNGLLDQRDQAITALNQLVQTTPVNAADGSIGLFIAGGQPLVLGANASTLKLVADPTDNAMQSLQIVQAGQSLGLDFKALGGGELAGLMQFQTQDLQDARDQIGQIALAVANVVNNQSKLGVNMSGTVLGAAGALFSIPTIAGKANANNTGAAGVTASINDGTGNQLQPSDYQVKFSSATAGTITRLSDGTSQAFTLPVAALHIDGMDFTVAGTPAAGDSFMLKPAAAVAAQLSLGTTTPQQLTTMPVAYTITSPTTSPPAMTSASSLAMTSLRGPQIGAQTNPYLAEPVTLTFNNTLPMTFNVSGNGTGNPTNVAYTPGGTITYNGWSMKLSGTPVAGDTVSLRPFADIGNTNSSLLNNNSLGESYSNALAAVGTTVQTAQSQAKLTTAIAASATTAATSVSGVNLDEEASKLLQYQQSYQASAKILQVAQTIFSSLMSAVAA